ncbi:MAG TPA: hypothetical protein PLW37_12645, partial [bacterium]|nr:hypothetical protein [bacterium]
MKKTILVLIIAGFLSFSCSNGSSDENPDLEQNDSSAINDEDSSDTGDTGNSGDSGNSGNSGDTGDTGNSG